VDHTSLKSLWEVVASLGRGKRVDRRSEPRLPAHGLVSIRPDVEGAPAEPVSLLGISEHGFSFRAAHPIAPEQKIVAEPQEGAFEVFATLEAVVRHLEPDGQEYVIGAEIITSQSQPLPVNTGTEQTTEA
jgi:hypothetical protein